jgi:hypothetical protein
MVRITQEIKERMIAMRKSGSTYTQICSSLGVTKERCIAYLKEIKPDKTMTSAMTNEWRDAEFEARSILQEMGFLEIHNLNDICSAAPSWDYLGRKGNIWWLVDVTINGQKSVAVKQECCVEGYSHAILLKSDMQWKLIELKTEILMTVPIKG